MDFEKNKNEKGDIEVGFSDVLASLKKYWLLILAVAMFVAGCIYAYFKATFVPTYTADVTICVYNSEMSNADQITDSNEYAKAEQLTITYMTMLKNSRSYLEEVIENLGIAEAGYTTESLRSHISVGLMGESTNYFYIKVTHTSRKMATLIVGEITTVFLDKYMTVGNPQIIDSPLPEDELTPSSSPAVKNAVIGFFISFLIMLIIVMISRIVDNRIRTVSDVEILTKYPVLGVIPILESNSRANKNAGGK